MSQKNKKEAGGLKSSIAKKIVDGIVEKKKGNLISVRAKQNSQIKDFLIDKDTSFSQMLLSPGLKLISEKKIKPGQIKNNDSVSVVISTEKKPTGKGNLAEAVRKILISQE